ncbi:MAG TPA: hypothetical protein VFY73_29425 [Ideonella sp.]|uniref:hypothetical protein n=1 Tax=Ideonella sp. TaxID=1929293 RepID=UPI002E35709F|nr:hypothetical protein [Ideonella sp.]HEX5688159.1 hypothetical protein [Ideonella sp.]
MNRDAMLSWVLGAAAVAVGYVQWGWRGVILATTLVVFWMLLQFSRAVRVMRDAASAPVGSVPSAVMLHAKLRRGMRLTQVLRLTGSLGRRLATEPETFEWADASGAAIRAELEGGRLARWDLQRSGEEAVSPPSGPSPA